jgi:hypothetical protein
MSFKIAGYPAGVLTVGCPATSARLLQAGRFILTIQVCFHATGRKFNYREKHSLSS